MNQRVNVDNGSCLKWTGGQYSAIRVLLAVYLLANFLALFGGYLQAVSCGHEAQWMSCLMTSSVAIVYLVLVFFGVGFCLLLLIGYYDRLAAILLIPLSMFFFGLENDGSASKAFLVVGLLVLHSCVPSAPYGSWSAIGRSDPAGDWLFPKRVSYAAWVLLYFWYLQSVLGKLVAPSWFYDSAFQNFFGTSPTLFEAVDGLLAGGDQLFLLGFTCLAFAVESVFLLGVLSGSWRRKSWLIAFLLQLMWVGLLGVSVTNMGLVILHCFAFSPAWVPAKGIDEKTTIFYDGYCALCHGAVRFFLAEDQQDVFRYSTLQGQLVQERIAEKDRAALPDSVIVPTPDGNMLAESEAILFCLTRLGGGWKVAAVLLRVVPRFIRDWAYRLIAAFRYRVFGRKEELCPILPPELRAKFLP